MFYSTECRFNEVTRIIRGKIKCFLLPVTPEWKGYTFDTSVVCISLLRFELLSTLTDFNETWYKYYDIGDIPTFYCP